MIDYKITFPNGRQDTVALPIHPVLQMKIAYLDDVFVVRDIIATVNENSTTVTLVLDDGQHHTQKPQAAGIVFNRLG
ncbi:hypothetical protein C0Z01_06910 [Photobacterium kishitanii]|uniref:Uncharacterized protein n=2 Tax=Photobacterium kishitanii TaxID=318456 RepID=A0A2T3KGW1_9GAMM|nr:hypothetical protein [Photobacterium kishitanii]KJG10282.1 hypothetical protein UB40_06880 [Photobacterium kishitanii]KJG56270.1 hypothetical protein UA38_15440 [Photobacterium kishitanii]KJG60079.1 hypothetical protein UA42_17405 [Photobacterium kishitanii]KJG64397.1 hypothetical protein UA40_16855 [Photobacterium kishitanii]KJG68586.1 hypothetical protein UA41_16285 [Photobacterium kishitanii]